jgi:hypothetical protein
MHSTAWEYSTDSFDWNLEGFSLVEPDGTERPAAEELVRVYPAAIAGSGETFTFSKRSRIGSLAWNATAGGITEVAIPSRLYPNGASVTVAASERELCGRYDSETGLLLLRSATDGGQSIRVTPNP